MARAAKLVLLGVLLAVSAAPAAFADKRTVCTITVNSADEKEAFRRYLPADQYQFVELVERDRSDWLASACRQGIRCDVLIVSGHHNGSEFFSDKVDGREFLQVEEMERASCSNSCPALFSQLKEVYLFGCNSLNSEVNKSASSEIERSLMRAGHSTADAERMSRVLDERHAESNRDVMRRIFVNTPAIYGFSSVAPVGPTAGALLSRYFQSAGSSEVGRGRANARLLGQFSANSMTVTSGLGASDPRMAYRAQVCQFVDDRTSPAQKLRYIHKIFGGEMAEARMFFERIESFLSSVSETERQEPSFVQAQNEIAQDHDARDRYLAFARDADRPAIRARMMSVALTLGWLSQDDYRAEIALMIDDLMARNAMTATNVDLICSLSDKHALDPVLDRLQNRSGATTDIGGMAALACLGSSADHARMLQALTSSNEQDVRMAEVYFYHRPIGDADELRSIATGIGRMSQPDAQVRALDTLARQHLSDSEVLVELMHLFTAVNSVDVQRAIAGLLIRSDCQSLATPEFVRVLREHRLKSSTGRDAIDVLIRQLTAAESAVIGAQARNF